MEKTTNLIMNAVKNFNSTATNDQKKLLAMFLVYNITRDACDNQFECIGLLDSVKTEMHEEFSKDNDKGKFNFSGILSQN